MLSVEEGFLGEAAVTLIPEGLDSTESGQGSLAKETTHETDATHR